MYTLFKEIKENEFIPDIEFDCFVEKKDKSGYSVYRWNFEKEFNLNRNNFFFHDIDFLEGLENNIKIWDTNVFYDGIGCKLYPAIKFSSNPFMNLVLNFYKSYNFKNINCLLYFRGFESIITYDYKVRFPVFSLNSGCYIHCDITIEKFLKLDFNKLKRFNNDFNSLENLYPKIFTKKFFENKLNDFEINNMAINILDLIIKK